MANEQSDKNWRELLEVVRYSDFPTEADEAAEKILSALSATGKTVPCICPVCGDEVVQSTVKVVPPDRTGA